MHFEKKTYTNTLQIKIDLTLLFNLIVLCDIDYSLYCFVTVPLKQKQI